MIVCLIYIVWLRVHKLCVNLHDKFLPMETKKKKKR